MSGTRVLAVDDFVKVLWIGNIGWFQEAYLFELIVFNKRMITKV